MDFEIIPDAPLPPPMRKQKAKYPFAQMNVGDGFDAPRDMGLTARGGDRRQNDISARARQYVQRNRLDAYFTVRLVDRETVRCIRLR